MASFVTDLWSSIFTAGATPTLLVATNATFAALQLVLALLLFATYSVHFIVLSFLSAALWWSINWFAAEVNRERIKAEEAEKADRTQQRIPPLATAPGAVDASESETETEGVTGGGGGVKAATGSSLRSCRQSSMGPPSSTRTPGSSSASGTKSATTATTKDAEELRKRRSPPESSGYVSTDSEWEKVDTQEK